jgi:hypothetical protein
MTADYADETDQARLAALAVVRNIMPSEQSSEVKFEIGHVLFIDIVGYSKLSANEQHALKI